MYRSDLHSHIRWLQIGFAGNNSPAPAAPASIFPRFLPSQVPARLPFILIFDHTGTHGDSRFDLVFDDAADPDNLLSQISRLVVVPVVPSVPVDDIALCGHVR